MCQLAKCLDCQWRRGIVAHHVVNINDDCFAFFYCTTKFVAKNFFGERSHVEIPFLVESGYFWCFRDYGTESIPDPQRGDDNISSGASTGFLAPGMNKCVNVFLAHRAMLSSCFECKSEIAQFVAAELQTQSCGAMSNCIATCKS